MAASPEGATGAAPGEGEMILIRVVRLQPESTFELSVPRRLPVAELKHRLEEVTGTPAAVQRLIYRGRVMKNNINGSPTNLQDFQVRHKMQPTDSQYFVHAARGMFKYSDALYLLPEYANHRLRTSTLSIWCAAPSTDN